MEEPRTNVGVNGAVIETSPIVDPDVESVMLSEAATVMERFEPGFFRIVVSTPRVDSLAWLAANNGRRQVFWAGRGAESAVAGVGAADRIHGDGTVSLEGLREQLAGRLAVAPDFVRYYGGLRFDVSSEPSNDWEPFGAFDFVLPRVELNSSANNSSFVLNVSPQDWDKPHLLRSAIRSTVFAPASIGELAHPVYRENFPDENGWKKNIEWALDAFSRSRLAKVVLARRATLGFESPVDPHALLDELQRSTSSCYHFLLGVEPGYAFVGASPERLFRMEGRHIWSEAVAGTRRRGETEGADAELCKELLLSEKDQREHVYVRQSIKETLSVLCSELHVDSSASEMRLTRGRHLVSRVTGLAEPNVSAVDLLIALHPTPAVGGYPTGDALNAITRLEGFDRGWYAAPIGWIAPDSAEFAVAIRSGLVRDKTVSLYSGAGIVGGSTPEGEWSEIEDKIADFVSVFGADGSGTA